MDFSGTENEVMSCGHTAREHRDRVVYLGEVGGLSKPLVFSPRCGEAWRTHLDDVVRRHFGRTLTAMEEEHRQVMGALAKAASGGDPLLEAYARGRLGLPPPEDGA